MLGPSPVHKAPIPSWILEQLKKMTENINKNWKIFTGWLTCLTIVEYAFSDPE